MLILMIINSLMIEIFKGRKIEFRSNMSKEIKEIDHGIIKFKKSNTGYNRGLKY